MQQLDIEKLNRENFRKMLNVLSMPATIETVLPLEGSYLLGVASVLLYAEVSYANQTNIDFSTVEAITNTHQASVENADYIFVDTDTLDSTLLQQVKKGDFENPEKSATIIVLSQSFEGIKLNLSGPGIKDVKKTCLPLNNAFAKALNAQNTLFPLGNEIFFLNENSGEIQAIARTTKVEVL